MASCCRTCFVFCGYALVPLIAILLYFHIQCTKEKELEDQNKFNDVFDPDSTDVKDYCLQFPRVGLEFGSTIGIDYILQSFLPCAVVKLVSFLSGATPLDKLHTDEENDYTKNNITFIDARKNPPGKFAETGFTLIELDEEPLTTDWRTQNSKDAEIKLFHKQMEPHIRNLYPDAKRILWTFNVVRGGHRLGDQPKAIDGPHLDYHQNRTARKAFHKEFPAPDTELIESRLLMGESDTEDEKLKILLGVWIPILRGSTVCDNPLAIMDASTFDSEHLTKYLSHINFGIFLFHNLAGGIAFDPKQRWYYYPFMTTKEVLVFHQYSEDTFFANPHTSFKNRNCPKDSDSRLSAEMRVALFF